jgi:two-component system copper resistance phosphate regulon response regulator CusR
MSTILLADDNRGLADFLSRSGYSVHTAKSEKLVISELQRATYGLFIFNVDRIFGQIDGLKLLERLLIEGLEIPVMVLSEQDRAKSIQALGFGVEDYLTKPFAYEELMEKSITILQRSGDSYQSELQVEDLSLNLASGKVYRGSREIGLSSRAFTTLHCLMQNPGVTVSRHQLSQHLKLRAGDCGYYITELRRKIDWPFGKKLISKKRGRGYQIGEPYSAGHAQEPAGSDYSGTTTGEVPGASKSVDMSKVRMKSDVLLNQMQKPEGRAAMKAAYNATPKQLGEAALAAVRQRTRG